MICAENNSIDAGQNVCLLQIDERSKFQTQKGLIFGVVLDDGFGTGFHLHRSLNFEV